jgi:hypothetical protein
MNIEDLLKLMREEWLWAAVAAISALAAIVGALLSWITAAFIKRRERPEADWAVTVTPSAGTSVTWHGFVGISVVGTLANAGDGAAFDVRIEGTNCTASFPDHAGARVPLLGPGDTVTFTCMLPLDGWKDASLELTWTQPPTRLKKKRTITVVPASLTDAPSITYFDRNMVEIDEAAWKALQEAAHPS